jgi:hypothetical protein
LPDMTNSRTSHGCARIKRSGKEYLVTIGGRFVGSTPANTFDFYDLTLMPNSWEFLPGIILPPLIGMTMGGKITVFDDGFCEAFVVNTDGKAYVCTGNYKWTVILLTPFRAGSLYLTVVDANLLGGDTVW